MHNQLKIFLTAHSLFILAFGMIGPIYAVFVQEIGGDVLAAGGSWAVFMIVSGIGIYIMGKIQDNFISEKKSIIIGMLLSSIGFLGYYFVSNIIHLFLVQIVLGLSTVVFTPAGDSFYTKYLEKGRFASQWAAWEGLYFTVTGVAALIGASLVKIFGFQVLFLIMFFSSVIGLVLALALKDKK